MKLRALIACLLLFIGFYSTSHAFDQSHTSWDNLLKKNVRVNNDKTTTSVCYQDFKNKESALNKYLEGLSNVSQAQFNSWGKDEQLAFLINAYNAFTVSFVLKKYPDLESIKDLGSFFSSPWKKKFISLFGNTVSLDNIEHDMIRARGRYDNPYIHVAVNCASIGCPALRSEAYTGLKLKEQLRLQMEGFLRDKNRNWVDATEKKVIVSKIFKWYGDDFNQGLMGISSMNDLILTHMDDLSKTEAEKTIIKSGDYKIRFSDYNWRLNDCN